MADIKGISKHGMEVSLSGEETKRLHNNALKELVACPLLSRETKNYFINAIFTELAMMLEKSEDKLSEDIQMQVHKRAFVEVDRFMDFLHESGEVKMMAMGTHEQAIAEIFKWYDERGMETGDEGD